MAERVSTFETGDRRVAVPAGPSPRAVRGHSCALALLLSSWGLACGVRAPDEGWIPDDAAVVWCAVAGPNHQLPPLVAELPAVPVPSGLFTRGMDPRSLDNLGFQRDSVVCAALIPPSDEALEGARGGIETLVALRTTAGHEAGEAFGRCACEIAARLDRKVWLAGCADRPTERDCEADTAALVRMTSLLEPIQQSLRPASLPPIHWRLVGWTDRPGWYAEHARELFVRYESGSELFLPGQIDAPAGAVSQLLAVPGAVAVVRQDGGKALMVARELDARLVIDRFEVPIAYGTLLEMLEPWQAAQFEHWLVALQAPPPGHRFGLDPRTGTLVTMDYDGLERVDRSVLLSAALSGVHYDVSAEQREGPARWVDRVEALVPFGRQGRELVATWDLSPEGAAWAAALPPGPLADLPRGSLGLDARVPSFHAPMALPFVFRGGPADQVAFPAPSGLYTFVMSVARDPSASIEGSARKLSLDIPTGPVAPELTTPASARDLRTRLSVTPHRITLEIDENRRVRATLRPR